VDDNGLRELCPGAGAELRSVIPTAAQAKELLAGHTIPVPLAVIASSAFGDKWVRWQREIATLSAKGSFTFTGTKSHNIHLRHWGAPRLPDSPSIRMGVWKGEVIASTEEELLS
jgi:hypothetical protein